MTRTDQAIRLVASWGLEHANGGVASICPASNREWQTIMTRIRFERISGLAVEAAAANSLDLTDEQSTELLEFHRAAMTWCLFAEQKLLHLADAFDEEGIDYAVLKGPALAHAVYEDPCLRPFCDLDLLVRSGDYSRANALLAHLGHARSRPEPRLGWEARFGKGSVHVDSDDAVEIDLHRTLVLGPFGQWIDADSLMAYRDTFVLGGRMLPRLNDTGMFLNVALHAALGWANPRIAPIRDCYELARSGSLDRGQLERWMLSWQLGAVFERAQSLVASHLAVEPGPVFHVAQLTTRKQRRLLSIYSRESRSVALSLSTARAIPGVRLKIQYAWPLAIPDHAFLRARGGGSSPTRLQRVLIPFAFVSRSLVDLLRRSGGRLGVLQR